MPFRLSFRMRDNNAKEAAFSVNLAENTPIGQVDALVSAIYSATLDLSSARFVDARWVLEWEYEDTPLASIDSNVYNRLMLLCTNGETYATTTIPSPANVTYLSTGPYRNFKASPEALAVGTPLSNLALRMAQTVLPTGEDFPQGSTQATLLFNPS